MKKQAISETEQYYINAKEAKDNLVRVLSDRNLVNAYRFLSETLGHLLTSDYYEEVENRNKLQDLYFNISYILEHCEALKEAEAFIKLLEGFKNDKAA